MNRIVAGLIVLVVATGARAASVVDSLLHDAAGVRGAFLARGMGARPAGLGEAFTAVADDASALSWNPGGLGRLPALSIVAMHDVAGEGPSVSYLAGAAPAGPGTAGVSLTAYAFGEVDRRDALGDPLGADSPVDVAAAAGWAMAHPAWLRVPGHTGVAVEVLHESGLPGTLAGFSAGSVIPLGEAWRAGWSVLRVGPAHDGFGLPATFRGGVAWTPSAAAVIAADAGYAIASALPFFAVGAEAALHPLLALRAGYRWRAREAALDGLTGVAAGLTVRYAGFGVEYAFQPYGALALSHRIALTFSRRAAPAAPAPAAPVQAPEAAPEPVPPASAEPAAPAADPLPGPHSESESHP